MKSFKSVFLATGIINAFKFSPFNFEQRRILAIFTIFLQVSLYLNLTCNSYFVLSFEVASKSKTD